MPAWNNVFTLFACTEREHAADTSRGFDLPEKSPDTVLPANFNRYL